MSGRAVDFGQIARPMRVPNAAASRTRPPATQVQRLYRPAVLVDHAHNDAVAVHLGDVHLGALGNEVALAHYVDQLIAEAGLAGGYKGRNRGPALAEEMA